MPAIFSFDTVLFHPLQKRECRHVIAGHRAHSRYCCHIAFAIPIAVDYLKSIRAPLIFPQGALQKPSRNPKDRVESRIRQYEKGSAQDGKWMGYEKGFRQLKLHNSLEHS
uniref:Uncharacterized protein n=1 Tax=Oryza punctata TaxID=4537 RepID=A0A0E0LYR6_ORYPU